MKKIVFSGFMASILMAGAAFAADANSLTSKGYVDAAAIWAKDSAMDYTDEQVATINGDLDGIDAAISDIEEDVSALQGKVDVAGTVSAAITSALTTAEGYTDAQIGELGEGVTVKAYVDSATSGISDQSAAISALQSSMSTAETNITNLSNNKLDSTTAASTYLSQSTASSTYATKEELAGKQGTLSCGNEGDLCFVTHTGGMQPVSTISGAEWVPLVSGGDTETE